MSPDPADLLCAAYDRVDPMAFRTAAERWDRDPELSALATQVAREAAGGSLARAQELSGDGGARAYAALRGLDRALAEVNPLHGAVPPPALAPVALRYARHGRLDTGAAGGGLLPRVAGGGRRGQLPEALQDALASVVRVPAADWAACDHAALPARARLSREDRDGGLCVAATPMIADPAELRWRVIERRGLRFYRVGPADLARTRRRVSDAIAALDRAGAAIGVAPELCLSPFLLDAWQEALAARAGRGRLRLVLVGTGNVDAADPPTNTAVLLDAGTGEVVLRQRKIFPFNLGAGELELWGLADRVQGPIDEDLTPGERVAVVELGGVRLAILVCEDLARLPALAGPLCNHGVSLLLVPVFARPTKDRRWERARAEAYSDSSGAVVVVANSLVVARLLRTELPVGTAIAVGGGTAAVGGAARPQDCVAFGLSGGRPELLPADNT